MLTSAIIFEYIGKTVALGGGAATVAYFTFQFLGKKWIENKFAERLEQVRHQQAQELQRLRIEIDSLLSGAIKLQEREFDVLPKAWARLDEAHKRVAWIASPYQEYIDLSRMSMMELDEYLSTTEFTGTQKSTIRSSTERNKDYQNIYFWYRLADVKRAVNDLHMFVARNGILFPTELKEKFTKASELLYSALISIEVGHEAEDRKMSREAWSIVQKELEPLYKVIEAEVHIRLQSHGRRPEKVAS